MAAHAKLTPEQLEECKRRHLVDGESINSLAKELGVRESTLRERIKGRKKNRQNSRIPGDSAKPREPAKMPPKERIEGAAKTAIEAVRNTGIPESEVGIAIALANNLVSVRSGLGKLAKNHLDMAVDISERAKKGMNLLSEADGTINVEVLKQISIMIDTANRAAHVGIEVSRNKKDEGAPPGSGDGAVKFYIPSNGR